MHYDNKSRKCKAYLAKIFTALIRQRQGQLFTARWKARQYYKFPLYFTRRTLEGTSTRRVGLPMYNLFTGIIVFSYKRPVKSDCTL